MKYRSITFFITLTLLLSMGSAHATKLYRWEDAKGNISYADKVLPKDSKLERAELNESGRTITIKEAAKTPQQLVQLKKIRALQNTKQALLDAQLKIDNVLLRTFQSESAMDNALSGKISMLNTQILQTKKQTNTLFKQLLTHQKNAANYERQGKKIPKGRLKNIATSEKQYNNNQKKIQRLTLQKATITESFQQDKNRLSELHGNRKSKPTVYNQGTPSLALGVLTCNNGNCTQLWKQALAFTHTNAMTKVVFKSKDLLLTSAPKEHTQLTLALTKDIQKNTTSIYLDIYCKDSKEGKQACKNQSTHALIQKFNTLRTRSLPNE